MKKAEYIKQLKRLIKKYHPDLCTDGHLESMYTEITKKLTSILNGLKINDNQKNETPENGSGAKTCANELTKIKEQDYVYYKSGMRYYRNIHPTKFYKKNTDRTFETKAYSELVAVLNNIFLSFNLAEYCFTKIIDEYPRSPWAADAKEKVTLLRKLYKRYENITVEENKTTGYEQFINEMGLKVM